MFVYMNRYPAEWPIKKKEWGEEAPFSKVILIQEFKKSL